MDVCGDSSRISFSRIFDRVHRRELGLYDEELFGGLLGFRMGIMMAFFQREGILLWLQELRISVWELKAMDPGCLRWKMEMGSGPVAKSFWHFLL